MTLASPPASVTATVAPRPRRRWLLIASLAFNILLVGLIGGAVWRGVRDGGAGPAGVAARSGAPGQMFAFIASLPPDRRAAIIRDARLARGEVRVLRQHVREAQRDRIAALTAEPFDPQRLTDAQNRLDNAEARLRQILTLSLHNAAIAMTPEERRAFVRFRPTPGLQDRDDDPGKSK
jgi:uncharacterized membrane protein